MLKIIICEDHPMYTEGLINAFKDKCDILGVFKDGQSVLNFFSRNHKSVDVLLLDLNLPIKNGFEVIQSLRENGFSNKILVLSMHDDKYLIDKAKKLGANAFCNKNISNIELFKAVNQLNHNTFFVHDSLEHANKFNVSVIKGVQLTKKEKEIIAQFVEGKKAKDVALEMNVSINTINYHKKNVYKKLEINTSSELLKYYYEQL